LLRIKNFVDLNQTGDCQVSIELTIKDPAKTPQRELIAALVLLEALSPGVLSSARIACDIHVGVGTAPLPPVDLPDVGRDIPNPTAAFGSAPSGHGSPELDADAAKLAAMGGNPGATAASLGLDPAAAFGAAPNAAPGAGSPATSAPTTASSAPAAPSVPAAAAAPAGARVVDINGLPWDHRIHSSSKELNRDQTWRAKRGVDKALVAQVEAELRAVMNIPPAVPNVPAAPGAGLTPPVPLVPQAPTTAPSVPATIPTAPAGAPSPVPPATIDPNAFIGLVEKCTMAKTAGKLTDQDVAAALAAHNIAGGLPVIAARPDLCAAVAVTIDQIIASKG
jgi:hypothetical protein